MTLSRAGLVATLAAAACTIQPMPEAGNPSEALHALFDEVWAFELEVLDIDAEAFCAPLQRASGVWFSGGSQQRIADAFVGTRVEREVHALLARGGVVGGSSAGTSISKSCSYVASCAMAGAVSRVARASASKPK